MKTKDKTIKDIVYYTGKIPPNVSDMEESLIGSIIINKSIQKELINKLKVDYFYKLEHQYIIQAILNLWNKKIDIDILTINNELSINQKLDLIGGTYFLSILTSKANESNYGTYFLLLIQKYMQREIISLCHKKTELAYEDSIDVFQLIEDLRKEISSIGDFDFKSTKSIKANKLIKSMFVCNEEQFISSVYKTGHKKFDEIIGFGPNKIMLIAGAAKHGKSKYTLSHIFDMLKYNENKLNEIAIKWITLEDSAEDIMFGYLARYLHKKPKFIKRNRMNFNDEEKNIVNNHLKTFSKYDIDFVENSATIADIGENFIEFCNDRKNKFKILIIDNILSLDDRSKYNKDLNAMYDYIMSEVLKIKQKTNACIIVIHHYKDAQQDKSLINTAYRPSLSDIKGSEAFRRVPNHVILINNPGKYDDLVQEYRYKKEILKYLFIADTGANRDDVSDDDSALIRYVHDLNYNTFQEL